MAIQTTSLDIDGTLDADEHAAENVTDWKIASGTLTIDEYEQLIVGGEFIVETATIDITENGKMFVI